MLLPSEYFVYKGFCVIEKFDYRREIPSPVCDPHLMKMQANESSFPHLSLCHVKDSTIFVVNLGDTENRMTLGKIERFHEHLSKIEKQEGPKACILVGDGKFFCNGLDFDELFTDPSRLLLTFHKLLARLLAFPVPLVAAINGHAFAGGAMIALACDFRLMSKARGFLCVNEVDIGLMLTPGMCAVIRAKADRSLWTPIILDGKRFTAEELLSHRLIEQIAGLDDLLDKAKLLAERVSKRGTTTIIYGALKKEMYAKELKLLEKGLGYAADTAKLLAAASKL
ncbi:enoyl-coa hydratase/isomerase family protein [Cardiosporidium cionae]|uniref:Enoyl-coa hydratase/isomerase family protein n=1 Tax=Cardiosporidium cionae TaxID=476202 RepID=A0ABQ7JDN5_9APIC|nr:enoyl-coa hydratase/isomerase family protein [Cardiosporidium cionae]|eukprot:KAF8822141.1 enoyl-coa hydratase/isomerase family protein [Cardiosporidium cionae]